MTYALDTNIIIHYFKKEPKVCKKFRDAVANGDNFVIPEIVNYEMRRGFATLHSPNNEKAYNILISQVEFCYVEEMDKASWRKAVDIYSELYAKRLTIGEMDILIAAFCLEKGYTFVTNNTKHFINIGNLPLEDWTI
jgi:predicted nucleic acid-binding protein